MTDYHNENLSDLLGKTLRSCVRDPHDLISFEAEGGERWEMLYVPDCCAQCHIEEIVGDLEDLVGSPIVMAEAITSSEDPKKSEDDEYDPSFTWTFYKLATVKGYVTIRWYGTSNGYYSETASFRRIGVDE
jgi:hypothetical protein